MMMILLNKNIDIFDDDGQCKLQQILIAAVNDFAIWPQSVEIVTSQDVRAASPSCPSSPLKVKVTPFVSKM